jgi:transposase
MKAIARQQRSHSIEFKREVVQEYIVGETLYGLAKRHDLSRQLIRVWVEKYESGGLDADAQAADLLHEYETKIAALELMGHDLTSSFELICAISSKLSFVLGVQDVNQITALDGRSGCFGNQSPDFQCSHTRSAPPKTIGDTPITIVPQNKKSLKTSKLLCMCCSVPLAGAQTGVLITGYCPGTAR